MNSTWIFTQRDGQSLEGSEEGRDSVVGAAGPRTNAGRQGPGQKAAAEEGPLQ